MDQTRAAFAAAIAGISVRAIVTLAAVGVFLALTGGFVDGGDLAVAEKFAYLTGGFYFGTKSGGS